MFAQLPQKRRTMRRNQGQHGLGARGETRRGKGRCQFLSDFLSPLSPKGLVLAPVRKHRNKNFYIKWVIHAKIRGKSHVFIANATRKGVLRAAFYSCKPREKACQEPQLNRNRRAKQRQKARSCCRAGSPLFHHGSVRLSGTTVPLRICRR